MDGEPVEQEKSSGKAPMDIGEYITSLIDRGILWMSGVTVVVGRI